MATEYKTLTFKDDRHGQKMLERALNQYGKQGWVMSGSDTTQGRYGIGKTVVLGAIFLPLALAGRKKGKISVILERVTN